MLSVKQRRVMRFLDIIELLLYVLAVLVFTIVFKLVYSDVRYLFLLGDLIAIVNFSHTIGKIDNKSLVNKNSNNKIVAKFREKVTV